MAGKRDSRRHSTASFSENVAEAETSYQILEVLSFCDGRDDLTSSNKNNSVTFLVKK